MSKKTETRQVKRKLRKWPWVLGVLVVIGIVVAVNSGGEGDSPAPPTEVAEPQAARIGQPARDGNFEFTVLGVDYQNSVGGAYLAEHAQGQYAVVTVDVTNVGTESRGLSDIDQYAFDSSDRRYSADSMAGSAIEGNQVLYTPINPGNSVDGQLVFDVPDNITLQRIELHDSSLSGGVTVDLE